MAQQETGLGWSAKDTWLKQSSGLLGEAVISTLTKDFPIAVSSSVPPWSSLVLYGLTATINGTTAYVGAWATVNPSVNIAIVKDYNYNRGWWFYAYTDSPGRLPQINLKCADAADTTTYAAGGASAGNPTYDSGSGLYWMRLISFGYDSANTMTITAGTVKVFETPAAALTYYKGESKLYYKLNAGYAVAAMVKWASLAGDYITTPVLISSVRDHVILSEDGTTEIADQMIRSELYNGIMFYMAFLNIRDAAFPSAAVQIADLSQAGAAQPKKVFQLLASESYANIRVYNPPDPYQDGDGSEEAGGDGDDLEDEPVLNDTHTVPSGGGFYKIFTPSLSDLRALSTYLWGTLDVDNFKRVFSHPIDCILGLGIVPVALSGTNASVYLGGIDTGLSFPLVSTEIYDFNMGSVDIMKSTGSYLDYAPYTKIAVYLPFIGFRELNTDDVMGETLTLTYRIDVVTGACIARISRWGTTLYQFAGSCLKQLPITGTNWDNAITGAITSGLAIGAGVASAGASAPVLAGAVASAATQALATKSTSERSGAMGGSAALMGGVVPYIVRSTPIDVIPARQNHYIGYPAYITKHLGSITGYNEIDSVHLEGIPATGDELAEIEQLLKGGVIL